MVLVISLIISIILLILFFSVFTFKQNVVNVLVAILALIPCVGPVALFVFSIFMGCFCATVESPYDVKSASIRIRNTSFGHWLFNTSPEEMFL